MDDQQNENPEPSQALPTGSQRNIQPSAEFINEVAAAAAATPPPSPPVPPVSDTELPNPTLPAPVDDEPPSQATAEFLQEAQAQSAVPVELPFGLPQTQPQPATIPIPEQAVPQTPRLVPDMSTIYPQATASPKTPLPQAPPPPISTLKNTKTKLISVIVIALGIYLAAPALLRLFVGVRVISLGFVSNTSIAVTIIDILYLIIGIGLILRRELARAAYVVIGCLFLLIALYGTFHVYMQQHKTDATADNVLNVQLNQDEAYCADLEAQASPSQKLKYNEIAQTLYYDEQHNIQPSKTCSPTTLGISSNQYVSLIPSYLLAILPLVFLTRPSVKEIFS
jgi:hypothetical protein